MSKKLYYKDIYSNFKQVFPNLSRNAVWWQPAGYCSIKIHFKDGATMIYDYLSKRGNYVVAS